MLLGCLVGPIIGALVGILAIWLVFLPMEARLDPEGFNYGAIYEILFIVFVFIGFGCIGGFIAQHRFDNRRSKQMPLNGNTNLVPDDKIWPPPPNTPSA